MKKSTQSSNITNTTNKMASRGFCATCLRSISVTSSGMVRAHGPVNSRCPGSNQQPRQPQQQPQQQPTPPGSPQPQSAGATAQGPAVATPPGTTANGELAPPNFRWQAPRVRILRRIPRASRGQASSKFSAILDGVVSSNSPAAWERLLYFSTRCLRVPQRSGRRWSLATQVNKQL